MKTSKKILYLLALAILAGCALFKPPTAKFFCYMEEVEVRVPAEFAKDFRYMASIIPINAHVVAMMVERGKEFHVAYMKAGGKCEGSGIGLQIVREDKSEQCWIYDADGVPRPASHKELDAALKAASRTGG